MSTINEKLVLANENVPKVYAAGAGGIDLSNYVQKTDYATATTAGVVKVPDDSGIELETDGGICIKAANDSEIAARTESCRPVVPSNLNNAVKASLSDNNRINDLTDAEKTNARGVIGAVGFTDYADIGTAGVIKMLAPPQSGLEISDGCIRLVASSQVDIDNREYVSAITPANLDYAVRSVRPNVVELSDLDIDITCEVNTIYTTNSFAPETLKITLPSTGQYGDFIQVDFYSGENATVNTSLTVLSPTAGLEGYDLNVEADCIYSLYFDWGCTHSGTNGCGWRFGYAAYPHEEV